MNPGRAKGGWSVARRRASEQSTLDAIVVGGGQAGLASGYWLERAGLEFRILDAGPELGASWRRRWDSLQLFTPARYSELPGMAFPGAPGAPRFWRPGKDEMASYLDAYARRFSLPVELGTRVVGLRRAVDRYRLRTDAGREIEASVVIAATGAHQRQLVPRLAGGLDPAIEQVRSSEYRNPDCVSAQRVLVVGAAASGVDISLELAADGRDVVLAGPSPRRLPRRILGIDLYWWLRASGILRVRCDRPPGRWICDQGRRGGDELVGIRRRDLTRAGLRRVGRVTGTSDGRPAIEGGELLDPEAIIWCTGYGYEYESWIELPVLDDHGIPVHDRGLVRGEPGLGLVGLPYQSRPDSGLVGGVGADARQLVSRLIAGS